MDLVIFYVRKTERDREYDDGPWASKLSLLIEIFSFIIRGPGLKKKKTRLYFVSELFQYHSILLLQNSCCIINYSTNININIKG